MGGGGGGGGMWGRDSGGAAAPPLLSRRFHELATKTGFYQTAGRNQKEKRESRDKGSLTEEERGVTPAHLCSALITVSTRWHSTNTDHSGSGTGVPVACCLAFTQWRKEKGLKRLLLTEPFISKAARETLEEL